jgi:hypothetical protein
MKAKEFKPNDLATIQLPTSKRRRMVEVISRPFPSEDPTDALTMLGPRNLIQVRMTPGEPTTLAEVSVADLERAPKERYVHVARVHGQPRFFPSIPGAWSTLPEDMLRYDHCHLYEHSWHEEGEPDERRGERRGLRIPATGEGCLIYRTSTRIHHNWTDARWQSFGTRIEPVLTRDLRTDQVVWSWRPQGSAELRETPTRSNLALAIELGGRFPLDGVLTEDLEAELRGRPAEIPADEGDNVGVSTRAMADLLRQRLSRSDFLLLQEIVDGDRNGFFSEEISRLAAEMAPELLVTETVEKE